MTAFVSAWTSVGRHHVALTQTAPLHTGNPVALRLPELKPSRRRPAGLLEALDETTRFRV